MGIEAGVQFQVVGVSLWVSCSLFGFGRGGCLSPRCLRCCDHDSQAEVPVHLTLSHFAFAFAMAFGLMSEFIVGVVMVEPPRSNRDPDERGASVTRDRGTRSRRDGSVEQHLASRIAPPKPRSHLVEMGDPTESYVEYCADDMLPCAARAISLSWLCRGGRTYSTLRFTTSKPIDTVIYSADFAIIPANTTTGAVTDTGTGSGVVALATQSGTGTGTETGIGSGSGFRTVPTTTGSSSTWTMTSTTSASDRLGSTTSSGVPPPSGTITGGGVPDQGQRAASAGRRGVDVEKLKFRFVFVIWPVLMGITMAL